MIDIKHFRDEIIYPVIDRLGFDKTKEDRDAAAYLLLATAIHESRLAYLKQNGGPAIGVYQIEPATINFIVDYAKRRGFYDRLELFLAPGISIEDNIKGNLYAATAFARVLYRSKPGRLPRLGDDPDEWILNAARYWKKWYNTELGRGTVEDFIRSNRALVGLLRL